MDIEDLNTPGAADVAPPKQKQKHVPLDEDLIQACERGIGQGKSQTGMSRLLGLRDNSMVLAAAYKIAQERVDRGAPKRGRARNLSGKTSSGRLRELTAEKREGKSPAEVVEELTKMSKLCLAIEDFDVQALRGLDPWHLDNLMDDVDSLDEWLQRLRSAVVALMGDIAVQARIAKLRSTEGRPPAEAEAMRRKADELERNQLNTRQLPG